MDRRTFVASAGAMTLGAMLAPVARAAQGKEDDRLRTLLDHIFSEQIEASPERATSLGLDRDSRAALKSQLDDYSTAGRARGLAETKRHLGALREIDRSKLTEMSTLDYDVVEYQLGNFIESSERFEYGSVGGRYVPYAISQLSGPYQDIPDFLDSQHKIETKADADAYLARLHAFARALDQSLERQRHDAALGVIAPDFTLDTTLLQLRALRNQPAAKTILVESITRRTKAARIDGDHAARAEAIVEKEIFPALDRQIAAVQSWRAAAVHDAGVWRLPDGDAYYAGALRTATTTMLSPAEVHKLGLEQVASISSRLDAILRSQGYTQGSVGERLTALNKEPSQLFANTDEGRAELLAQLNRQIKAMYARLPEAFKTLPKAPVEVRRVPPFIQDGAPGGYYNGAALDGSRPAAYYINLKDTFDRPKFGLPTLTYHEAVPGHHLQISLAQESAEIPMIRRLGGFSAYSEGWALYAEQLADEMGVYAGNPLAQAGYLQSFLFRAARLVVDSGLHAKRWSREQATDYFMQATGIARGRSQREIDRYSVWPGQACSYKVGHISWERLRDRTKTRLGAAFDIRDFHEVLVYGAMPLTILERLVDARVQARLRS